MCVGPKLRNLDRHASRQLLRDIDESSSPEHRLMKYNRALMNPDWWHGYLQRLWRLVSMLLILCQSPSQWLSSVVVKYGQALIQPIATSILAWKLKRPLLLFLPAPLSDQSNEDRQKEHSNIFQSLSQKPRTERHPLPYIDLNQVIALSCWRLADTACSGPWTPL